MLFTWFSVALACSPIDIFVGFDDQLRGMEGVPTDAGIPIEANLVTDVAIVDLVTDERQPDPTWEARPNLYGAPTIVIRPQVPLEPDTPYRIWAAQAVGYMDIQDTVEFTTGPGPAAEPGDIALVSLRATDLGDQTNDCDVGTHRPRDLEVTVDLSAAEPLSWLELSNRDLRTWVSLPIDAPGIHTFVVFQPVQDDPESKDVNCITARLVTPSGAFSESEELCVEVDAFEQPDVGCGCTHDRGAPGFMALGLGLLAIRRR